MATDGHGNMDLNENEVQTLAVQAGQVLERGCNYEEVRRHLSAAEMGGTPVMVIEAADLLELAMGWMVAQGTPGFQRALIEQSVARERALTEISANLERQLADEVVSRAKHDEYWTGKLLRTQQELRELREAYARLRSLVPDTD